MSPLRRVEERDDDDMAEADGDVLVASRAQVDLRRRIRLNTAKLRLLVGERVGDEVHEGSVR
jgi:hypothetical protein